MLPDRALMRQSRARQQAVAEVSGCSEYDAVYFSGNLGGRAFRFIAVRGRTFQLPRIPAWSQPAGYSQTDGNETIRRQSSPQASGADPRTRVPAAPFAGPFLRIGL